MQLDPGPSGPKLLQSNSQGATYKPKRKKAAGGAWTTLAKVLGIFLVTFFLTNLLLYEKLTDTMTRAKGMHKTVAKHVQKGFREAIKVGINVKRDVAHVTSSLPHPQIIRWRKLPTVMDLVDEDSLDPPEVETLKNLPQRELPDYMNQPSVELDLDAKYLSPPAQVPPSPASIEVEQTKAPQAEEKAQPEATIQSPQSAEPTAEIAVDKAHHHDAPGLAAQVLSQIDIHDRLSALLDKEVDTTLSQILLEMKGSISCGGHAVMELKDFEEVAGVTDIMAVLPETDALTGSGFGRCAVVGNSGTLLSQLHGQEIDAHDTVIRFNRAPTRGYEEHVGTKTTIRLQNVDNLGYREKASDKYLIFSARNLKDMTHFVGHRHKHAGHNQFAFNPEFWCHVWDWVAHRKLKPTSGMAGVVFALKHCQHPVDLYGFSHNATEFHYFNTLAEKVTHKEIYRYHPLVEEAEIYRELQEMNMTHIAP